MNPTVDLLVEWNRQKSSKYFADEGFGVDKISIRVESDVYREHRHLVWGAKKAYYRNDEHIARK